MFAFSCNFKNQETPFPFNETDFFEPEKTIAIDTFKNKLPDTIIPSQYSIVNNILVERDKNSEISPPLIKKTIPEILTDYDIFNIKPINPAGKIFLNNYILSTIKAEKKIITGKIVIAGMPVSKDFQMPVMKDDATNNIMYIDVNQNLPGNDVRSMIKDKYGRIWVGTDNGLAVFEGECIKIYKVEQGLSHNVILKLMEDSKDRIWIGTKGGGVCVFDGKSFVHYTTKQGLSFDVINDIFEDSEGKIWLATDKGGIDVLDLENNKYFHFGIPQGLSNYTTCLVEDDKKQMWIGTGMEGIFTISGINSSFENDSLKMVLYKFEDKYLVEINSYYWIADMIKDSDSRIWLGSVGGGFGYIENQTINYYSRRQGMLYDEITSLMEDSE
jgi:hypothetical protein